MNWDEFFTRLDSTVGGVEGGLFHKALITEYNKISPLPRSYKVTENDPWCAIYVSAMWHKYMNGWFPYECSCSKMVGIARNEGKFYSANSTRGGEGWLLFYDWERDASPDHVGYIVDIDAKSGQYRVIEGNYSDAVNFRVIPMNDKRIYGLVKLEYSDSEVSEAREWVTRFGIMKGDGTDTYWQNPPTREQLAVILKRLYSET